MKAVRKHWATLVGFTSVMVVTVIVTLSTLADAPQPVLRITSLASNYFDVAITNGISTTNYTLFWTPALNHPGYPWQVWSVGNVGQSNFLVDGGEWSVGFFKVLIGTDSDGDGSPEWQDAQPWNPSVGILTLTIDSPTSGFNFN